MTKRPRSHATRLLRVCNLVRNQTLTGAAVGLVMALTEEDIIADRERARAKRARCCCGGGVVVVDADIVEVDTGQLILAGEHVKRQLASARQLAR
jgi:hypothetical protein